MVALVAQAMGARRHQNLWRPGQRCTCEQGRRPSHAPLSCPSSRARADGRRPHRRHPAGAGEKRPDLLILSQIQTFWIEAATGPIILISLVLARLIGTETA